MKPPVNQLIRGLRTWTRSPLEDGLTLIEGLVAILVVSAVTISITPAIFLAVATRVQNRRAEQAIQLAHGQIDQVRVLMEQGITPGDDGNINQLPELSSASNVKAVDAPTDQLGKLQSTNFSCSTYDQNPEQVPALSALPVDVDGDCKADFFVQTFRTNEVTTDEEDTAQRVPIVFRMGVRVYAQNAQLGDSLETEPASLTLSTGEGQQRTRPLAVLYTVLAQGDLEISFEKYECFLNGDTECN